MQIKHLNLESELRAVIAKFTRPCVIDVETTGLNWRHDSIVSLQVTEVDSDIVYFCKPDVAFGLQALPKTNRFVAHNFRFDYHFLLKKGVNLTDWLVRDTMLLHHLIDENKSHSLDDIVKNEFNDRYKEEFWSKHKTFEEAPKEEGIEYACKDVFYTAKLYVSFGARIRGLGIPTRLVEHTHNLAVALFKSEHIGVDIDLPYLMDLGAKIQQKVLSIESEMRELVKNEVTAVEDTLYATVLEGYKTDRGRANAKRPVFNFDSTKHLIELIYVQLQLPEQHNKAKKLTTDDAALVALKDAHPVIELLRDYRENSKLYCAFIEGMLDKMDGGRVYPSFNVNGTVTGRLSSSGPNLQQMPRDGGVRGMFIPRAGHVFLSADFAQLEIILAAHFSEDPILLEIINTGASLHDYTAEALGLPRHQAKTLNFSLVYGATEFRISAIVGCSMGRAKIILNQLWNTYKGLKEVINKCHEKVDKGEPIINPFGRRRNFNTDFSTFWEVQGMKRQAFNALIQSTGADLTNRAFYIVSKQLESKGWGRAMFPIHDEILIEVKKEFVDESSKLLVACMEHTGVEIGLKLPLKAECSKGMDRWKKN